MATKDFIDLVTKAKFVAGGRCRFNGALCRQWAEYHMHSGCWVYQGTQFHSTNASRAEISGQHGNPNARFERAFG